MASPQVENGHIRVANDLWEAIFRMPLSGCEFRALGAILRKLYGWGKITDAVSLSQIAKLTGMAHTSYLVRVVASLEQKNILHATRHHGKSTVYAINKDYDTWQTEHLQVSSHFRVTSDSTVSVTSHLQVPSTSHLQVTHNNHVKPLKTSTRMPSVLVSYVRLLSPTGHKATDMQAALWLEEQPDYDPDKATTILTLWRENFCDDWRAQNPGRSAPPLGWLKDKIMDHIRRGTMPIKPQRATGNDPDEDPDTRDIRRLREERKRNPPPDPNEPFYIGPEMRAKLEAQAHAN